MIYLNYSYCVNLLISPFESTGLLQWVKCRGKDKKERKSDSPIRATLHVAL